jgi:hypothetical protein
MPSKRFDGLTSNGWPNISACVDSGFRRKDGIYCAGKLGLSTDDILAMSVMAEWIPAFASMTEPGSAT